MITEGNITIFGEQEGNTIAQIRRAAQNEHVYKAVLTADGHLGYGVPIGGVIAYEDAISPTGVGYDIGCGNLCTRVDINGTELRKNIVSIMDDVFSHISFGVGGKSKKAVDDPIFDSEEWKMPMLSPLKDMARAQLSSVGSGNHYVDLFTDEQDRVWIGVHFGSRGLGHKTATYFLKQAGAKDGMDVDPCVLPVKDQLAQDYIVSMRLALRYAASGREWVCKKVADILGATIVESVHNNHNAAWEEVVDGRKMWVVRKGATPAFPGQLGFVGGTMAEPAVILEGVESEVSKQSLYSTVHGAGRVLGRMEAKGKVDRKTGEIKRFGKVSPKMMQDAVKAAHVELRGAGVDESPHCYKRLPEVLAAHAGSIKILHTLTPVGVAMASAREFDPYKD